MHRPEIVRGSMFQSAGKTSRVFQARFSGTCRSCQDFIETGDDVLFDDDELVHADCVPAAPRTSQKPCEKCWLAHAGECM